MTRWKARENSMRSGLAMRQEYRERSVGLQDLTPYLRARVHRLLTLRIGDGEQIAVVVVRKGGRAIEGVGELCDPVKRIGRIERLLAERIGHVPQSPRRIQNPLCFPIERIFHLHQIARFIGERGDIAQGIGDREWLVLGIDRDGGGLVQGIRDGREMPCGIVAERGCVGQWVEEVRGVPALAVPPFVTAEGP